jgi:hypothetical protein
MSAVSSVNPGVASLSQLLSNTGSATVTSALSTPAVQSALKNASTGDLVQLSDQALQLQETNSLFSNPASSSTAATPDSLLLQALNSSLAGSTNAGSTAGSTAASLAAASTSATATATLALEQVSDLFGTNSGSGNEPLSILG